MECRLQRPIRRHNARLIPAQCLWACICCNQTGYYPYTSFARHSFLIKLLPQMQRCWQRTLFLLINGISWVFVSSVHKRRMPLICPIETIITSWVFVQQRWSVSFLKKQRRSLREHEGIVACKDLRGILIIWNGNYLVFISRTRDLFFVKLLAWENGL